MTEKEKARQFLRKTSQLPPVVEFYFGSETIADGIDELNNKYQIPADYLSGLITDIVLADFDFSDIKTRFKKDLNSYNMYFDDNKHALQFSDFINEMSDCKITSKITKIIK